MPAPSRMGAGEAVARVLERAGVDTVFGVIGGSMLELLDALHDSSISYIGSRDERAAGHMADAAARLTGGPGVVLGAQAGPGVANLATALAEAHLAYSPVVAIAGAISRSQSGRDTFQEIDQEALLAPVTKRSIRVPHADRLCELLDEALRVAMTGRRGPVVLHVPRDLFASSVSGDLPWPSGPITAGAPADWHVEQVKELLAASERPVIVAGGGLKWARASAELDRLARALDVPVVAATGHHDVLATDHPLLAGQAGPRGNRLASRLTREADVILALGTRLGFNSTFHSADYLNPDAAIVQVDIDAMALGRHFPVTLGIIADAGEAARAFLAAIPETTRWQAWTRAFHDERRLIEAEREVEARLTGMPLSPARVLGEIRDTLPRDAIVTLDTGAVCLQAADRLRFGRCPGLVTPLDFGLVGFGYAAALGAQAAAPGSPVIAIMGDGGFGLTMIELTTAVQHDLPVIAVVLDNRAWGAEKAYQRDFFDGRYMGADLLNPPFADYARLIGANGWRVRRPGETAQALSSALESGRPAVIHVDVDPDAIQSLRKDLFPKA